MGGPGLPFLLPGSRDPSDAMDTRMIRRPRIGIGGSSIVDSQADPLMHIGGAGMGSDAGGGDGALHPGVLAQIGQALHGGGLSIEEILRSVLHPDLPQQNEEPIVPYRAAGRPFTLAEMGNAEIGDPKPTWKDKLGGVLQGVAQSNTLDPNSDNPVESFLSAGLRAFGGARQQQTSEAEKGQALDRQIINEASKSRRQAREDQLSEEVKRSQIGANRAIAIDRLRGDANDQVGDVDVRGLAAELRAAGQGPMASFVEANPNLVRKNPSSFTALVGKAPLNTPDEKAAEQARTRADRATERATTQVLREENATDPETGEKKTYTPEQRVRRYNELIRMFNPNYAADSTLALTIKGFQGAAKKSTAANGGKTDQAGLWANELQAARALVVGLNSDLAHRKLVNAGYSEQQIKEILATNNGNINTGR